MTLSLTGNAQVNLLIADRPLPLVSSPKRSPSVELCIFLAVYRLLMWVHEIDNRMRVGNTELCLACIARLLWGPGPESLNLFGGM